MMFTLEETAARAVGGDLVETIRIAWERNIIDEGMK